MNNGEKIISDMVSHLVRERNLRLTIEVDSEEAAQEIIQWMYSEQKPMKSVLHNVAWGPSIVSEADREVLEFLRAHYVDGK